VSTKPGQVHASLAIALDKPFQIGDFIIVDGYLGTVEHIGLKTTRIRSLWREQIVFSNNDLLQSRIRNFKRMAERRVVFTLGVVYRTPYDQLARIPALLREVVEAQPGVRFDRAHFKDSESPPWCTRWSTTCWIPTTTVTWTRSRPSTWRSCDASTRKAWSSRTLRAPSSWNGRRPSGSAELWAAA